MSQPRKRNPKRETVLYQAQQLMLAEVPPLNEIVKLDQPLRQVVGEGNPFLQQWIRFFDGVVSHAD